MSTPSQPDPRVDQAAVTDASLLAAHEKLLGTQPDEKARYKLMPLNLLFLFSGLIFFGGTYLGRFSGHFHPAVFNENSPPPKVQKAGEKAPKTEQQMYELGKATYAQVCIACHQATGQGLPPAFPPLAGSEWVQGSEDRLIRIILHGLMGPIKVKGVEYGIAPMPATGPGSGYNLSTERVAAVATFVRKEWGNTAGPVTEEKVIAVRDQTSGHAAWTAADLEKIP
ncbi:MAG: cytochrome c [Verrucomicrobiota bacterium]